MTRVRLLKVKGNRRIQHKAWCQISVRTVKYTFIPLGDNGGIIRNQCMNWPDILVWLRKILVLREKKKKKQLCKISRCHGESSWICSGLLDYVKARLANWWPTCIFCPIQPSVLKLNLNVFIRTCSFCLPIASLTLEYQPFPTFRLPA